MFNGEERSGRETALTLYMLGYPIMLVHAAPSKLPLHNGWPDFDLTPEIINAAYDKNPDVGIAIKLGGETQLVDIEGDGPLAEVDWKVITSGIELPLALTWESARGTHRLFTLPEESRTLLGEGVIKINDLEVRLGASDRFTHYSIVPPSGDRTWADTNSQSPIDTINLPLLLAQRLATHRRHKPMRDSHQQQTMYPDGPGSVFNEQADWSELLTASGWKPLGSRMQGVTDWCRPGKEHGLSATTGYCGDRLYVFTSNAPPLQAGDSYDKFQFYAHTQCDSDFPATARKLASLGYVRPAELEFTDLPHGEHDDDEDEDDDGADKHVPTDMLLFPGFVSDFAHLHARRAHRYDLRAGAMVGIMLQSWLMGRRVKLEDGTRPNIAGLLLGPSSYGKSAAVDTMDLVLRHLGESNALHRKFKSWQGLEDAIEDTPNMLYVQEEAQDLLRGITDPRQTSGMHMLASTIKELLTAAGSTFRGRHGAVVKGGVPPVPIDQPHLTMMLTGLSTEVWSAMTDQLLRDGFAGRLWPVELIEMAQRNDSPYTDPDIFSRVLYHAKEWLTVHPDEIAPIETNGVSIATIDPITIYRSPSSQVAAKQFALECDDMLRKLSKNSDAKASVWGRAHELMCTLELLITGSASPQVDGMTVSVETTRRAIQIVKATLEQKVYRMETRDLGPTIHKETQDKIVTYLRRKARQGHQRMAWRDTYRGTHISPVAKFNEAMAGLMLSGDILSDAELSIDGSRLQKAGKYICLPEFADKPVDTSPEAVTVDN